eukprot:1156845-Pelagomonas_calceolata.AAC.6
MHPQSCDICSCVHELASLTCRASAHLHCLRKQCPRARTVGSHALLRRFPSLVTASTDPCKAWAPSICASWCPCSAGMSLRAASSQEVAAAYCPLR